MGALLAPWRFFGSAKGAYMENTPVLKRRFNRDLVLSTARHRQERRLDDFIAELNACSKNELVRFIVHLLARSGRNRLRAEASHDVLDYCADTAIELRSELRKYRLGKRKANKASLESRRKKMSVSDDDIAKWARAEMGEHKAGSRGIAAVAAKKLGIREQRAREALQRTGVLPPRKARKSG